MSEDLETKVLGSAEDLAQPQALPVGGSEPSCPDCGSVGFRHQWYAQGVLSVRGYLCTNLSCPRARQPWYTLGLQSIPGKALCPRCGQPYMTIFQAEGSPRIYLHKVKRSGMNNGLLVVTEACSVELSAFSVGTGG